MIFHVSHFVAYPLLRNGTPQGDLFLPTVEKCVYCGGSGILKIWGRFDIKCSFCAGSGANR
jgi:hypothetical protein